MISIQNLQNFFATLCFSIQWKSGGHVLKTGNIKKLPEVEINRGI